MRFDTSISIAILCTAVASSVFAQTHDAEIPGLSAEQQIASAVLPLPSDLRAGATVLGYSGAGMFTTLREGRGSMICLASDPKSPRFHVACYHRSLEPFMAPGTPKAHIMFVPSM